MKEKKENRRSSMTKEFIKTAFLELLKKKSYPNITITDICKKGNISRSSFYLHYDGSYDVLESILKDIFIQASVCDFIKPVNYEKDCCKIISICQFVRNHKEYHIMFTQEVLSDSVLEIFENLMKQECKDCSKIKINAGESKVHHIFDFYFAGCFYILKKYLTASDATWKQIQSDIMKLTDETIKTLRSREDERKKLSFI